MLGTMADVQLHPAPLPDPVILQTPEEHGKSQMFGLGIFIASNYGPAVGQEYQQVYTRGRPEKDQSIMSVKRLSVFLALKSFVTVLNPLLVLLPQDNVTDMVITNKTGLHVQSIHCSFWTGQWRYGNDASGEI